MDIIILKVTHYFLNIKLSNSNNTPAAARLAQHIVWANQAVEPNRNSNSRPAKSGRQGMATRCNRAAAGVTYDDQIPFDWCGCGTSSHCGQTGENVKIWFPAIEKLFKK